MSLHVGGCLLLERPRPPRKSSEPRLWRGPPRGRRRDSAFSSHLLVGRQEARKLFRPAVGHKPPIRVIALAERLKSGGGPAAQADPPRALLTSASRRRRRSRC